MVTSLPSSIVQVRDPDLPDGWQQWRLRHGGSVRLGPQTGQISLTYNGHGLTDEESGFICRLIDRVKGIAV